MCDIEAIYIIFQGNTYMKCYYVINMATYAITISYNILHCKPGIRLKLPLRGTIWLVVLYMKGHWVTSP